ncbi:hypothetical protein BDW69DRAFT_180664 [Aspergillus filifer]
MVVVVVVAVAEQPVIVGQRTVVEVISGGSIWTVLVHMGASTASQFVSSGAHTGPTHLPYSQFGLLQTIGAQRSPLQMLLKQSSPMQPHERQCRPKHAPAPLQWRPTHPAYGKSAPRHCPASQSAPVQYLDFLSIRPAPNLQVSIIPSCCGLGSVEDFRGDIRCDFHVDAGDFVFVYDGQGKL